MNIFRKYGVVIGIVAVILAMVVIRSTGNHFRPDALKWAQPSFDGSCIVTSDQAEDLGGNGLLIVLDGSDKYYGNPDAVSLSPLTITEKKNIGIIRNNDGPVILYSEDPALSAATWMTLSQIGIKNLYILSDAKDDEVLKNEFRPDTLIRPEL